MVLNKLTLFAVALLYLMSTSTTSWQETVKPHNNPYVGARSRENPGPCPNVSVRSHSGPVRKGERLDFEAFVDSDELDGTGYTWSIEGGKILSGQGAQSIDVQTDVASKVKAVSATVRVSGLHCPAEGGLSVPFGKYTVVSDWAASVVSLKLDKNQLYTDCKPGYLPLTGSPYSEDMVVNVSTLGRPNSVDDTLKYYYTISAGMIVGSGPKVRWDLTGVEPGTYTIESAVDDGGGKGNTQKAKVVVAERRCWNDPSCPTIQLSDVTKTGRAGEYLVTANISGSTADQQITYTWSVSNGEIISGQRTPLLKLKAWTNSRDAEPVVTVKLGGLDPLANCPNEASVTIKKDF